MAELEERLTRELTVRYIAVLAVLAVLALASFIGLANLISDATGSAERVNLAGRQRMLVERAAFAANHLVAVGRTDTVESRDLLVESLNLLEMRHQQILGKIGAATEPPPPLVLEVFDGDGWHLDRDMAAFIAHGRALLGRQGPIGGDDLDLTALSTAAAGALLSSLDEVTSRFQQDGERRMNELFALQGATLIAALVVLLVSATGVFRPMVERLRADIRDRLQTEAELREGEDRLRRLLEESPMGVSVSRRSDGQIVFANSRFTDILGMDRNEFIGSSARDHYVDDNQRRAVLAALRRDGRIDDAEVEFRRKNGAPFWSLLTIRSTDFEGASVNLAWIYDITERKAAQQQLLLAAKVLDTINEGVVITDANNKIVFVNPAFSLITEYSRDEVIGVNPSFLRSGRHDAEFYAEMWSVLLRWGRWSGEVWNRRKSGEFFAEWLSITAMRDGAGNVSQYVAVFSDITHRKEDEERVWRQANYDALTGLPNRALFLDRLNQAVRQSRRENKAFALMFLDLDGFKAVNDTLGHAAGDVLLQQTAHRLSECMRSSDTLARLAGDEFVIILQGIRDRSDPSIVAQKILETMAQPFNLEEGRAEVRASIGISMFPENGDDAAALLKLADEAMYDVKRRGKNSYLFTEGPSSRNL
ncbi:PAS/PAC domain-containing protein [Candidatus Terasakiella magnetica]|nr:PAS/PAC domain-containing protein [Candidatus Terasakiella magnetica]